MDSSTAQETHRQEEAGDPAIRQVSSHLCFWVVAGATLWLDLWSKDWVFRTLAADEIRSIIAGTLDFRRSLNDGAVFGSFRGNTGLFIVASLFALGFVFYLFAHSSRSQRSLHVALGLILAGALGNLYDRAYMQADVVTHRTASGTVQTIIGKILSEPDDPMVRVGTWPDGSKVRVLPRPDVEIRRQGVVRDFLKFVPRFPAWVPKLGGRDMWPWVFNVADASLVCGVSMLLLSTWLDRSLRRKS